ncbi:dihydrodipicolinate synthase family protein [Galbibacter pacificus]|uniref:Dihydrodipicolinate synthase family protein n=1 Tax=Galbibacter pacificus TaxID=2996052 RepID=A0ABT6FN31_9FLAO|nr:dihydrodipicolinate synthase family protein [Galbibacter pacificus]MDG3581109.1 dihydrodipicolinate synthase family protein [Galbibacter pacificus]MDG3584587.1 dihydrodipicolinate synthase family protein [Galbibacter pacificus]
MKLNFKGLIAAGFSPFNLNGDINLKQIPVLVDKLINNGINGFYLMGSTGEGLSIKVDKRNKIVEAYAEAINKRVPIIVNVSHSSYEVSADLTRHAIQIGADAVSATPPAYYSIENLGQLTYAVEKIADCQDRIPFIYYHIPGKTGLNFKMHLFLEQLEKRIPQLGGIKYTAPALDDFMICKENFGDRFKMFFGVDELFLPALSMGADTFIGSTYNFMSPYYQTILKNYGTENHQLAVDAYLKVVELIDVFLQFDGLAAQKSIMQMIGHNFGPPKAPILPLTTNQFNVLEKNLESLDYFKLIKEH